MQIAPDAATVDLTRTCLKLRADVTFSPQVYDGTTHYHIEVPAKSTFYRIGYTEYVFVSLLDGRTTFCEALALTARVEGGNAFTQHQALTLYSWLLENEVAVFADEALANRPPKTKKAGLEQLLPKLNPFWLRLPLGKPEAFLKAVKPLCGWIFSPTATVLSVCLMLAAVCRVASHWSEYQAASSAVFARDNWLWLLVVWIGLKSIHETAHGLACQRYGGTVRETGIILAFFAPLAYVDVTSSWSFPSKWHRIHTAAAGMYVELLLAAIAVFAWPHATSEVTAHLLYNIIVMASISTLLFNANPLMRFDGYYIFSDLLQIPNLYSQSSQATQQLWHRTLFGMSGEAPTIAGDRLWVLQCYGVAALCWRLLICASMMIAASVLFHGAGVALSLMGVIAWFAIPLWKTVQQALKIIKSTPGRLIRAAIVTFACVGLVIATFLLPVPFGIAAPGSIALPDGCNIRSKSNGFVDQIHVRDGQTVTAGELLVSLRNEDVTTEYTDLQLQLQQETIRRQTAMKDHEAGLAAIADGNLVSLRERLVERSSKVEALNIYAEVEGVVVTRQLEALQDRYLREGDEVLTVDPRADRKLRISVAQEDFTTATQQVNQPVHIRLGTREPMHGRLTRVIPRASRRLPDPSLAATDGGSLPVMAAETDEDGENVQLTEPRFEAVVDLDVAQIKLPIGERGYATIGRVEESVGAYVYDRAAKWLTAQIESASRDAR